MSISLYQAVLPKNSPFAANVTVQNIPNIEKCILKLKVSELILNMSIETAEAIRDGHYKKFDALVKNFGCQITALEVFQIISGNNIKALEEEAAVVQESAKVILLKVNSSEQELIEMKNSKKLVSFFDSLELSTSDLFAKFVRLRLLCVVNDNKPGKEPNVETPYTNYEKIPELKKESPMSRKRLIDNLQIEEAKMAASFIQNVTLTNGDPDRLSFVNQMLKTLKTNLGIVLTPLTYNTEAVLRAFNGILLIKNKLNFCGKPLAGRKVVKVPLKMPEERVIKKEELRLEDLKKPILVIEGYIDDEALLISTIHKIGIIAIVSANCATLPQYVGSEEGMQDLQAKKEIAELIQLEGDLKIKAKILNIDHFYAASLLEEMGDII